MQLSSECSAPKHAGDSVNVDPVGHQVEKDVHRDDAQQSKGVDSAEVHLTVLQPAARPLAVVASGTVGSESALNRLHDSISYKNNTMHILSVNSIYFRNNFGMRSA